MNSVFPLILDMLSLAIIVCDQEGLIQYSNAKADGLLRSRDLLQVNGGKLTTVRCDSSAKKLHHAIAAGAKAQTTAVALESQSGERAVAFAAPLEPGLVAIFVASRHEDRCVAINVLRPMFDFTPTEAIVAYAAARGDSPETISNAMGNTIATVRTHLKAIYAKADVPNKTALAVRVSGLLPPIALA